MYQLPIYFQAIQGDSPVQSGIKMIPSILAVALATGLGSGLFGRLQVFQPFLLAAAVLSTVGCGLIFTFDIDSGLGPIIGYQILFGVGIGLGVQVPNLVATVTSAPEDVSTTVASVACKWISHQHEPEYPHLYTDIVFWVVFMMVAGGWGVAATDAVLNNILLQRIPRYVPGLDGHDVLAVGAAGINDVYSGEVLAGVHQAYLDGLHAGWALGTAAFGISLLWAVLPKWPGRLTGPAQQGN
jgi:hypothetical protein